MQLKRILARDTRSATDKAIALYGDDVLIISNHMVNGQTELVVALDLPAAEAADTALPLGMVAPVAISLIDQMPVASRAPAPAEAAAASAEPLNFMEALRQAEWKPAAAGFTAQSQTQPEDARDYLRGREIVDLVRDELASLRREFRLGQQTAGWQSGLNLAAEVQPLARAMGEAAIPQELRALMLDTLKDHASPEKALQAINEQLTHSLNRPAAALPDKGVHLVAGPSGAGKTLMAARMARHVEQLHGAHQVALISYQDVRAGAWSQIQMLASQLGIDCYRAGDAATLALLLNELNTRRVVLIDTPGVQMKERVAEVLAVQPDCQCHAVVPADASSATLHKLAGANTAWDSVLISKVDECAQPWPLLNFLSNNSMALAGASDGVSPGDLITNFSVRQLVSLGLSQLHADAPETAPDAAAALVQYMAPRDLQRTFA
jgi:flagellar biosynthesis GTPase FlhF